MNNNEEDFMNIENLKHTCRVYPFGKEDTANFVILLTKTPKWVHRFFMSLFFGFKFELLKGDE